MLGYGFAMMREVIATYKRDAKRRGFDWKLTEDQFFGITQKDCFYCGSRPENIANRNRKNGPYIYNGIDRKDNKKGYTLDNVVACCKFCNRKKGAMTLEKYKDWIFRSYNKMFIKESR